MIQLFTSVRAADAMSTAWIAARPLRASAPAIETTRMVLDPHTSISETEIIEYCRKHVGSLKIPRTYEFHESLPKSDVGKILKRALRQPHWSNH